MRREGEKSVGRHYILGRKLRTRLAGSMSIFGYLLTCLRLTLPMYPLINPIDARGELAMLALCQGKNRAFPAQFPSV